MGCTGTKQISDEKKQTSYERNYDNLKKLQSAQKIEKELCKQDFKFLTPINSDFLDELFRSLSKKNISIEDTSNFKTQKGFRKIKIQDLQPRKFMKPSKADGRQAFLNPRVKKLLTYEESCPLSYLDDNGFFRAFFDAYLYHGDVKITPDDVWLIIMLYFSNYVDQNAEQLRMAFVNHQGKKKIVINTSSDEKDWSQFFQKVILEVKKQTTKGVTDNLTCDFSTTNPFYKVMSTATIMNAYQQYFAYERNLCICGIQNIHMGGNLKDWQKIIKKTQYLRQFDVDGELKKYIDRLIPVLDQLLQTFRGNPNLLFWNNIYHQRNQPFKRAYQPTKFITGWMIRFFTTGDQIGNKIKTQKISVPINLVNSLSKVQKEVYLVGGCQGVSVERQLVYRPHFSYSIVQYHKSE